MQKVFNVAVDIGRKLPAPAFEVNTNDLKSVKLLITITNGQTLLDLTDTTVRIAIRKPDNHIIFQDCTVKDATNGQVEIILENQAYITPGTHTAEIMCYKGSEVVAVSGTFSYKSTKGIMNDEAVESKSEFTTITGMLKDVQDTIDDVRENGTGIDAQARKGVEDVTAALAERVKKVNGKTPDVNGELTIDIPKAVNVMERIPTDLSGISNDALIATVERSVPISWNVADWEVGSLASATGLPFAGTIRIRPLNYMAATPSGKYVVFTKTDSLVSIFEYKEDNTFIKSSGWLANEGIVTLDAQTTKIKLLVRHTRDNYTVTVDFIQNAQPIMSRVY